MWHAASFLFFAAARQLLRDFKQVLERKMSGVEAAGLVLGAFPIVVQLIHGYKEGCQPLRHWKNFGSTFQTLMQGIRYQETRLQMNVRMLLLPLVDDDEEVERLLRAPRGVAWKNRELEEALQRRLSHSYTT